MLMGVLVICALLTMLKPYEITFLFTFLDVLGNIVPPLAGIIFADYYIIKRGHYEELAKANIKDWNIMAWITWAISVALVYVIPFGQPSVNGIVISMILYVILMKLKPVKTENKEGN